MTVESAPTDEVNERIFVTVNEVLRFSCDLLENYENEYDGPEGHKLSDDLRKGRWIRLGVSSPENSGDFAKLMSAGMQGIAKFLREKGNGDIKGVFGESDLFRDKPRVAKWFFGFTISNKDPRLGYMSRGTVISKYG